MSPDQHDNLLGLLILAGEWLAFALIGLAIEVAMGNRTFLECVRNLLNCKGL